MAKDRLVLWIDKVNSAACRARYGFILIFQRKGKGYARKTRANHRNAGQRGKFPLIVSGNIGSGNIGVKEIERLIQLEIDKEILADHGEQPEPDFLNERRRQLSRPQNQNSAAIIIAPESTLTAI